MTVGRRAERDVALAWDTEVSRLHAQLEPVGGDWIVVDDGLSRNGTYVNGERVNGRRRLRDGDRIVSARRRCVPRARGREADSTAAITRRRARRAAHARPSARCWSRCAARSRTRPTPTPATNKDIADEIYLSVDAVKAHLRVLFERFGLDDLPQNQKRARLAAVALVNGVVKPARVLSACSRTSTLDEWPVAGSRFCSDMPRRRAVISGDGLRV